MPTIFNNSKFDVWVAAIEKHLAPYESVVIADAKVAEQLVKTGILSNDLAALKDVGEDVAALIATWHDEHSTPADQVVDHDAGPVELAKNATAAALKPQPEPAPPVAVPELPATRTDEVRGAEVVEQSAPPVQETR